MPFEGREIDDALIAILRDRDVKRAGEGTTLAAIASGWRRTGLRRDDMFDALDRLFTERCVRMDKGTTDVCVTLQVGGEQRVAALDKSPEDARRRLEETILTKLDGRRHDSPGTGRHRRATDVSVGRFH